MKKSSEMVQHLEFVLGVVNRLSQNSFMLKGWTVTLVSAIMALSAKGADRTFILVVYFPALLFWLIDGYYLYQERLFRRLYERVRLGNVEEFSMSTKDFDSGFKDWLGAILSRTLVMFYGGILLVLQIVMR